MAWTLSRVQRFDLKWADCFLLPIWVVGIYGMNRLTDEVEDSVNCPEDLADARSHRCFLWALYYFGLILLICEIVTERSQAALLVGAIYLIAFLYSSRAKIAGVRIRLKSWFVSKMASVAAGWTVLTVLYPAFHAGLPLTRGFALGAIIVFTEMGLLQVIGDLRDEAGDRLAGLRTLPVCWSYLSVIRFLRVVSWIPSLLLLGGVFCEVLTPAWALFLIDSLFCSAVLLLLPTVSWRSRNFFDLFLVVRGAVFLLAGVLAA